MIVAISLRSVKQICLQLDYLLINDWDRRGRVETNKTVGELVDQLFKTHLRPDGKEYTYQEVAAALNGELDATYIGKLRSGKITNPGRNVLKLLCLFFRVPSSHFFPELDTLAKEENIDGEQRLQLALRSIGLDPETQAHIQALVRALSRREN